MPVGKGYFRPCSEAVGGQLLVEKDVKQIVSQDPPAILNLKPQLKTLKPTTTQPDFQISPPETSSPNLQPQTFTNSLALQDKTKQEAHRGKPFCTTSPRLTGQLGNTIPDPSAFQHMERHSGPIASSLKSCSWKCCLSNRWLCIHEFAAR